MEQKRTLWIITAAGFFLLVVLLAALNLYKTPAISSINKPASNKITWVAPETIDFNSIKSGEEKNPEPEVSFEPVSGLAPALDSNTTAEPGTEQSSSSSLSQINTDNVTIYSQGNTTVYGVAPATPEGNADFNSSTTIDVYEDSNVSSQTVTAQNQKAKIAIEETQAVKHPETKSTAKKSSSNTAAASGNTKKSASAASTATVKPAASKSSTSASASTSTSAKPVTKEPDRFWIQVGSFTSKKAADEARTVLDSKGFQCEVFTTTNSKGTLFYRVRIGPYTTKAEAEYWNAQVLKVPGYEKSGSYITNSSAQK